jgi:peptide/nickel transport system substrate-binding protein
MILAVAVTVVWAVHLCAEEKPQGELIIAISTLGREIWTPIDGTMAEQYPALMFYDTLLLRGTGEDQNFYPGLAESWTVSDDNLTYTFNIRKGVEFHEGWGPFTAEDALYSLKLIGSERSHNAYRNVVNEWIDSMEAVSPYVFRVKLKSPHTNFLLNLSNFAPFMMMVSKKYFETEGPDKAAKHPVGTGPFVLKKHKVGDFLEVEAVDQHWNKTAEFKKITIRIVPELSTRIAMLKAGDADAIDITTSIVDEVKASGFDIVRNPGASFYTLLFGGQVLPEREAYDPTIPWTDDKEPERSLKVRKALSLAVNKQAIIDYILKGNAGPFAVNMFAPGSIFTDPEWKPYPYDPEEAKRLLAEAGYPNGFEKPIKMHLFTLPGRAELPDCGEAVAMDWEKIGLKVDRVPIDWGAFRSAWYSRSKIQRWGTCVLGITPWPDPLMYYHAEDITSPHFHAFESQKTHQMILDGMAEVDPAKRRQKTMALGQYIYDNYLCCPIAMKDTVWATSDTVSGWTMNSLCTYLHNVEYIHRKSK